MKETGDSIMNFSNHLSISDEELLNACLQGEQWAWEIFYKRFKKYVFWATEGAAATFTYKYKIYLTKEDLKDCEQFVWASFLEKDCYKLRRWRKRCELKTWIKTCGLQSARYFFRSKIKPPHKDFVKIAPNQSPLTRDREMINPQSSLEEQEMKEKIEYIRKHKLAVRENLFLTLRYNDELSYEEISKIMNLSIDNLYLLNHRTIKKVKKYLIF